MITVLTSPIKKYDPRRTAPLTPKMAPCKDCGATTRSHILEDFSRYCHKCKMKYTDEDWESIVLTAKINRETNLEKRREFMAELAKTKRAGKVKEVDLTKPEETPSEESSETK